MPWFGGVRGIWYRKDQFAKAGITSPPTTWAELVSDAKQLMKTYPGTYGLGAPSNYTNAIVSFIWGAGGQVAVQQGGKWVAQLNSPQSEAGIKFYADLLLTEQVSPAKYIGQTELGTPGATSGGATRTSPWASSTCTSTARGRESSLEAVSTANKAQLGVVPDPERERPEPGAGLRRRLRPRRLGEEPEQDGGLGPGHGHGQPVQRHHVRQLAGLLPARSPRS